MLAAACSQWQLLCVYGQSCTLDRLQFGVGGAIPVPPSASVLQSDIRVRDGGILCVLINWDEPPSPFIWAVADRWRGGAIHHSVTDKIYSLPLATARRDAHHAGLPGPRFTRAVLLFNSRGAASERAAVTPT
ncbi:hypothetical protein AAFF_G00269170 [Aldrovandia affinis]|uniref:Uncharacterized protein n=1 Tax=Aldrovandia affinis TaxID=143900 RepID=A0AAD7SSI4_9TELE|nr:hypothetical protein AAFF_G00269170 [Aldrovandia affinis]